eukprot:TRINITY_DN18243_c0_g1_i1.p1 TRINITY_DN18243_c0_g1~~TRINITY_DN18243_c0_g1_i1.p1  ORF type:complete len:385 (-),score=100.64 TRINITY_DN18243_c0_g1_i1:179-1333(-)
MLRSLVGSEMCIRDSFKTQDEPAYCGLGTLAMALNTLAVDPGRVWKGVWRWYHEDMLDCCKPLDNVKQDGIPFDAWLCLARCNGATVAAKHASESSEDEFREVVRTVASCNQVVLTVSYSRKTMNQTGDGHFSPIGGYNAARDMVLIMDVARFKHPPHWVPLCKMFESMTLLDPSVAKDRGYAVLSSGQCCNSIGFSISQVTGSFSKFVEYFSCKLEPMMESVQDASQLPWHICFNLPASVASFVVTFHDLNSKGSMFASEDDCFEAELKRDLAQTRQAIMEQLQEHPLYRAIEAKVTPTAPLPVAIQNGMLMILGAGHLNLLPSAVHELLAPLLRWQDTQDPLHGDLQTLLTQLESLAELRAAMSPAGGNESTCCSEPPAPIQ